MTGKGTDGARGSCLILHENERTEPVPVYFVWHSPPSLTAKTLSPRVVPSSAETPGPPPLLGRFLPLSPSPLAAGAASGCLSCAPTAMRGINQTTVGQSHPFARERSGQDDAAAGRKLDLSRRTNTRGDLSASKEDPSKSRLI